MGQTLSCSATLLDFLQNDYSKHTFDNKVLETFSKLDDYDIMSAVKAWIDHEDYILSYLCNAIVNRKLPKIEISNDNFDEAYVEEIKYIVKEKMQIEEADVDYLVYIGEINNKAYNSEGEVINIMYKTGELNDIMNASDSSNIGALSKTIKKYFICYPKNLL